MTSSDIKSLKRAYIGTKNNKGLKYPMVKLGKKGKKNAKNPLK